MSDTVQLVPSAPVVPRPEVVRPERAVEPAKQSGADNRAASNGNDRNSGENARSLVVSPRESGGFLYQSVDNQSGEVVWQYPPEGHLRMSQSLRERDDAQARPTMDEKA
jgi:hypothetical protein